jgi:2-phospho-L-lactate/phosphoenolpyruvate guanylyltransferase
MLMKAILIPVKQVANAKQRLATYFSASDRAALADALWQDFFRVVAKVQGIDRVFVISAEERVLIEARGNGWEIIPESRQISESESVDFGCRWCAERGIDALLRLPVDLPLAEHTDIESLSQAAPSAPGTVMVPSRDGDGTNALLRTPPTLFPSRFGRGSFRKHLAEAERSGAVIKIVRNPRIEMDIDEMDDLLALNVSAVKGPATRAWLETHEFGSGLEKDILASRARIG